MKNVNLLHDAMQTTNRETANGLIKQFILSNEMQANTKFDMYNYCAPKNDYKDSLKGIYYENGYKYATDGHLLVKVMESYPNELEGKIIDKKGAEISGTFPKCNAVIPQDEKLQFVAIDFKRILEIDKVYKIDKKADGLVSGYVVINGVSLSVPLLARLAKFAISRGIKEIGTAKPNQAVKIGRGYDNTAILMPMVTDIDDILQRKYEI